MTAFAGIVTFDDAPNDTQSEDRLGSALAAPRVKVLARRAGGALFAQRTAADTGAPPLAGSDASILFAADARLDNRAELGAALALAPPELARTPDAILVLQMVRRWGDAGLARCLGAFAFALWDAEARRLVLARDYRGDRALFFHRGRGFVAFASTLGAMLALPHVPREIDEIALADFLVLDLGEARRTFYRGIERVPSRTLVTIDRAGVGHRHYWSPNFDAPPPYRRDEDYIERARELFDQAVAAATAGTPRVAIATSGGLDSSAIAATVARLGRAERIDCYTNVAPAEIRIDLDSMHYLDERPKVEALARMYPALNLNFLTTEKPHAIEEDNTRLFVRSQMPLLGAELLGMRAFLHEAAVSGGHRSIVYGTAGNFALSWGGQFILLALLRAGRLGAFMREFNASARLDGRGVARTFGGDILMPAAPAALRRLIDRLRGRAPDSIARYSALNPAFIAEHDLVRRWRHHGFDPWFGVSGWHPARYRASRLFDNNQIGHDYRAMGREIDGLEILDPHGDRRLVEFLLAVPEPMYRRNGIYRWFARAVLADRLPPEILGERRFGAHGVTWFRRLDARRPQVAAEIERLEASALARRLIDVPRLKRLINEWPADERAAERRRPEFKSLLTRGVHVGRFIRWVEGGNA